MARLVGTWELAYTVQGPQGESAGSGIERHRLSTDGRFKMSDFEGTLFGEPYTSHGVQAWVPGDEQYVTWYFDASSAEAQISHGSWIESEKAMVKWSEGADFSGRPARWKQVLSFPASDQYRLEMFVVGADDVPKLSIVCTGRRVSMDPDAEPDASRVAPSP